MKYLNQILTVLLPAFLITSCKKDEFKLTPLASLNVTNVVIGGKTVRLNSNRTDSAVNMSYKSFSLLAGNSNVYLWPTDDSTKPFYNKIIKTNNGDVYSLFLAGDVTTQIDTMLIKESIPYRTDSTAGVRFINLSPNSPALNINQYDSPAKNEVSNLAYKGITEFKTYPALSTNGSYVFEIRDAVTGDLLTSYTLTTPRFANVTLVIRGLVGGSPGIGVTRVNNDR